MLFILFGNRDINLVYFPRLSFFLDTPDKFRPIEP